DRIDRISDAEFLDTARNSAAELDSPWNLDSANQRVDHMIQQLREHLISRLQEQLIIFRAAGFGISPDEFDRYVDVIIEELLASALYAEAHDIIRDDPSLSPQDKKRYMAEARRECAECNNHATVLSVILVYGHPGIISSCADENSRFSYRDICDLIEEASDPR